MKRKVYLIALFPALLLSGCDKISLDSLKEGLEGKGSSSGTAEIRDIDASEFDSFVGQPGKVVVVDFHADWCPPCKVLGPRLEKVAAEFGDQVAVGKIDVDQAGELAARLGVSSIPDVRIYRGGVSVDRFVGAIPEQDIRSRFERETGKLEDVPTTSGEGETGEPEPAIQPMTKDWLPPGIEKR